MQLAVSTVAFKGHSPEEILRIGKKEKLFLEFSTGFPPESDPIAHYRSYPLRKMPHNYFPPPKDPFVLNLASADEEVRERSIAHCEQGLRLSKEANAPFFAAHAGFCLDPKPEELGDKFCVPKEVPREAYMQRFRDSLGRILPLARELKTPFLIENNVIAPFNLSAKRQNPLLCCDPYEIKEVWEVSEEKKYFGILLDTGHFKVSAQTLDFGLEKVKELEGVVKGVHHSDNDGQADTNGKVDKNYWFLPYLHAFKGLIHVLEVKGIRVNEVHGEFELLEKHANG